MDLINLKAATVPLLAVNKLQMDNPIFTNGFTSWMETHHEIVAFITTQLNNYPENRDEENLIYETKEQCGTGGIWELAKQWTDEFEKINEGRIWDGEFYDDIDTFCKQKNQA